MCEVDASDPRTVYVSGFDDTDFTSKTWKSTNGGQTFEVLTNLPNCAAGGFVRSVPETLYVFAGIQCSYSSTDDGATFHQLVGPPAAYGGFEASPDGTRCFAVTRTFNTAETFRSIDQGASLVAVMG